MGEAYPLSPVTKKGEACPQGKPVVHMRTLVQSNPVVDLPRQNGASSWFALKVRTRSEAIAVMGLRNRGYEPFSPTYHERRQYSDRLKAVDLPLFPGYVFC